MAQRKVVVVEDERHIAQFLAFHLERAGYEPFVHEGGAGLEDWVARNRPVAVLLDLGLPGRSGEEICRRLGEALPVPPPVVFVTGRVVNEEGRLLAETGARAIFCKPFSMAELVRSLNELVEDDRVDPAPLDLPPRDETVRPARDEGIRA